MHQVRSSLVLSILLACGVAFSPSLAFAHAMRASVKWNAAEVFITVKFDGDEVAPGANVSLFNPGDKTALATASTDANGTCSFPRPLPGKYLIVAEDAEGHRAEKLIEIIHNENSEAAPNPANRETGLLIGLGVIALLGAIAFLAFRKTKPVTPG